MANTPSNMLALGTKARRFKGKQRNFGYFHV